jgi:hypothetical protein
MRQIEKVARHHRRGLQQHDLGRLDLAQDRSRVFGILPAVAALFVKQDGSGIDPAFSSCIAMAAASETPVPATSAPLAMNLQLNPLSTH